MARNEIITTNFTAGVWSPRLRGRTDLEKYASSLRDGENIVILKHGGITARPPLDYKGTITAPASEARLVPFTYDNETSYVLEFGGGVSGQIKVWKDGALVAASTISNPYLGDALWEFDYVQSGDTMIMVHPSLPMKRLRRFSETSWALDNAPLDPGPFAEIGGRANITLTLDSTSGSVHAIASSDFWRQGDVGRTLTYLGGTGTVTVVNSSTDAEITISATFPTTTLPGNGWLLHGSPLVALTPSAKDPVGTTVSLIGTSTAFRDGDVGAYVQINGGLVRLTSVTGISTATDTHSGDGTTTSFPYTFQILSAAEITVVVDGVELDHGLFDDYTVTGVGNPAGGTVELNVAPAAGVDNIVFSRGAGAPSVGAGVIVQELASTTQAPADAWVLKHAIWNAVDGYPSCVTLHQQRLWAGNTPGYPQSFWGSRSGLFFDFTPGTNDDHAVYKTMDSPQANPLRFLHAARVLIGLTDSNELEVRGGVEKPITQTNAAIDKQSKWGCTPFVKPEEVGDNLVFAQRGAKVLRAIYPLEVEGFAAKDISIYSENLLQASVAGMTFQQTPESVLWVWLEDGTFLAITYNSEQNMLAIAPCSTGTDDAPGFVESMCTVPEGNEDATYALVRRVIGGATTRYLERFNWDANPGMDSRKQGTTGPTTWGGFSHLAGEDVTVLMDGLADGTETVNGSGQITTTESATTVYAGLAYTPTATLQNPEVGTGSGTAQGQAVSVHRVTVRFLETFGCNVNDEPLLFERFGDDPLNPVNPPFTGDMSIPESGWSQDGSDPLTLSQPQPYPWTVLAVIRHIMVNAG